MKLVGKSASTEGRNVKHGIQIILYTRPRKYKLHLLIIEKRKDFLKFKKLIYIKGT